MTFLQFVCHKLLGDPLPPPYQLHYGDEYWPCPFCGREEYKFHTMPSSPDHKDRYKCFVCGVTGDEYDLIRHLHSRSSKASWWNIKIMLLHQYQHQYQQLDREGREGENAAPTEASTSTIGSSSTADGEESSSPRGLAAHSSTFGRPADYYKIRQALGRLSPEELRTLIQASVIAVREQVDLVALVSQAEQQYQAYLACHGRKLDWLMATDGHHEQADKAVRKRNQNHLAYWMETATAEDIEEWNQIQDRGRKLDEELRAYREAVRQRQKDQLAEEQAWAERVTKIREQAALEQPFKESIEQERWRRLQSRGTGNRG